MKRTINRILIAALLLGNPAIVMPMEEVSVEQQQDCPVCFDTYPLDEFNILECGHNAVCRGCLQDKINLVLNGRDLLPRNVHDNLRCPTRGCVHEMSAGDVRSITEDEAQVARFSEVMLGLMDDMKPCPTRDCPGRYPVVAGEPRWLVLCAACQKQYCSQCTRQHEPGQNELQIDWCFCGRCNVQHEPGRPCPVGAAPNNNNAPLDPAAQRALEQERQSIEWRRQNTRPCPGCAVDIEKNDGCNHMTCRNCRHHFCWQCLSPWAINENHPTYYECRARPAGNPARPAHPNSNNEPYDGHYAPVGRNYTPFFVVGGVVVAAAASYGAYKLYKYLTTPKPAEEQDLKTSLELLHKEAIKSRARLVGPDGYVAGMFKAFFNVQETAHAYKDLDATSMTRLQTIVNNLETALIAGNCDKQYAELVKFIAQQNAVQTNKPAIVQPVNPVAPVAPIAPAPETKKPVVQPIKPVQVKQTHGKGKHKRPARKVKTVKPKA